jgi:peptidoglycan/xylan/chitin deacetylase (PgdA/CDA1 family)
MRTVPILIYYILFLGMGFAEAAPKIILKLDDLFVKDGVCAFLPTMDYLVNKQLKAGLGIIAGRNDSTALKILMPYLQATNSSGEKLIEIWHHGLDHSKTEFKDSTYEYQKQHFEQADERIKELLGIQMHSFGTPYNAGDSVTNQVISENPNYKVYMFGSRKPNERNGILYLNNRVNMENATGNPEFSYFIENYTKLKGKYTDYMVLQGHPNQWTPDKLEQFKKIIDFLISEGCMFELPYEYFQSIN